MAEKIHDSPLSRAEVSNATAYDDIFMRKNLNDTGTLPVTNADWWTQSPDIIPNGADVIIDPVNYLTKTYGQDVGKATVLHRQNYFYVRGKNSYNGERKGDFYLYYCPQHLFLFPSLWIKNQLKTSSGSGSVSAIVKQKDNIVVPNEPFIYTPESSEHSCLIGRVVTAGHPNPLPDDFENMNALTKYILEHPNMAWRNVNLIDQPIPTFTENFNLDSGTEDSEVLLGIRCHNVSDKSRIAFSCGTPIPSGPDQGKYIIWPETEVKNGGGGLDPNYMLKMYLPAGFKTVISFSYWAQTPIQKGWKVFFEGYNVQNSGDELYERAHSLPRYGINMDEIKNIGEINKSVGLPRVIRVGSVQVNGT